MRIVLFSDTFVPKIDGIVTTLCETIRQLRNLGHDVLIVAPDGGLADFEQSPIIAMKGLAFPLYPELRLALPRAALRDKIREFAPDLIHVADPVLLGIAGLYFAGGKEGGALGLPLVVSYHTDLPAYLRYYKLSFLEPYIWRILRARHGRATLNLCTSQVIAEELVQHGIQRVAVWPGGVDTRRFHPGQRSTAMRHRLSKGHPDNPLLVYVGRLSPEKDLERLKPILQGLPGARLALVGDGPHRKALERCFAGLPVVMPGFLRGDELAAAYAAADVFVMPSRTETLGLVVLEALSSGVPVVAARAGGIPEMVEDGVSACLFDDEQQAIEQIRAFLESPQRSQAFGAAGRAQAARQSWGLATSTLLTHYEAAIAAQELKREGKALSKPPHLTVGRIASRSTLFALRKLLP